MTRKTDTLKKENDRRIISFEPTEENLAFLEAKKGDGVPYAFTITKALDHLRKAHKK